MALKKKIIAYILAFSSLLSTNAFAFLEDIDDVPEMDIMAEDSTAGVFSESDILNAYKLLNYVGSVSESEEEFEENKIVTKAYAANSLAVIASGSTVENAVTDVFSDVSENHEYMTGIAQALNKGIISEDNKFYPNKNISAEELADMALKALKYDYIYSNESALSRAIDIGLFKGVKYSQDEITVGQFMIFLKNVLDTDYIKVSGVDSHGGATVEIVSGVSHLEKYFDIYKQDGILTGYKFSSINGDANFDEGKVEINRGLFNLNDEISMDYVGAYVDAYVDNERDNLVITVDVNEKKNHFESFEKSEFISLGSGNINFYNEEKRNNAKISENAIVMYNNTYYGLFRRIDEKMIENADRVLMIDNDGDEVADIVKVEKYSYYFIKSVSVDKETIVFDKNGGMLEIEENSWAEFKFENEKIELKDLKAADVLTVLESTRKDNSRIFSAVVSRVIEEGKINKIDDDDCGKFYVVGEEKYYLSDEFINYMNAVQSEKKPQLGHFLRFYISSDKKVVATISEDDFSYGYVMSGTVDVNDEVVRMNVYNLSGALSSYYFADKVKVYTEKYIEGVKKEKLEAVGIYLGKDISSGETVKFENDVLAYTLDADGKISSIVKPIDRTKHSHGSFAYPLTLDYDGTNDPDQYYLSRIYREVFASQYKIMSSVPILAIPEDDDLKKDEKAYGIKHSTSWGAEGKKVNGLSFKIYNCDKFYVPEFCTMIDTVELTMNQGDYGECYMYAIENIGQSLDEDNNVITQISYYNNGKLTHSPISEDVEFVNVGLYSYIDSVEELKKGDVVQIKTDTLGDIYLIRVLFSLQERPSEFGANFESTTKTDGNGIKYIVPKESILDTTAQGITLLYGRVEDIKDNVVLLNTSKSGTNSEHTYPVVIGNSVYKTAFYSIYNTKTKKVTPASLSEIQPNDTVLMRRYYNHIQDTIIIR